jgi:AcrR family transcriptional regulator
MSLYRHVRDKDDLLDEVVDRLLARAWKPRGDAVDWRAWVFEAADRLRRFLVSQPAALHVFLAHPVVSPAAVARINAFLAVLQSALGDEQAAQRAYAAIHSYILGFSALEASRAGRHPSDGAGMTLARPAGAGHGSEPLAGASHHNELVHGPAADTKIQQFAQGLTYLLNGIELDRRQPARRRCSSPDRRPRHAN